MNQTNKLSFATIPEFVNYVSVKHGDKTAFIYENEDKTESITYVELSKVVERKAQKMRDEYGTNRSIALVGENTVEWVIAYFAILYSGNIAVPLEPDGSVENTIDNLSRCDCNVLLFDNSQRSFVQKIMDECATELYVEEFTAYSSDKIEMEKYLLPTMATDEVSADQIATIIFTSGTTGRSKGVKLTHLNICSDTIYTCIACPVNGRTITVLPFHHMYAIVTTILLSLYYGAEIVICSSAKKAFRYTATYNPTYLFVVPMILEGLCKKIGMEAKIANCNDYLEIKKKILGDNFSFFVSGGAILSHDLQEKLKVFDIAVYNGYGITECSPVVSVNRQDETVLNSTVGPALPCVDVCIMHGDENGEGEICVRGDIVMSGYLNDPEATKEAFYGEWFRTGDIGKLDSQNRICITGRCKNLIILSNGKNVSPEEIEEKLQQDQFVQEIIVYAEKDSIVAAIYPSDEEISVDYQAYFENLVKEYNDKAPLYKRISRVEVVKEPFARTATGKIKRNVFNF